MTPKQQQIAIAEACGWNQPEEGYWRDPQGYDWQVMYGWQTYKDGTDILPDYLNDLNAMHEAENLLEGSARLDDLAYRLHLQDICGTLTKSIRSTARQRAEAFLKTLDLWKE